MYFVLIVMIKKNYTTLASVHQQFPPLTTVLKILNTTSILKACIHTEVNNDFFVTFTAVKICWIERLRLNFH